MKPMHNMVEQWSKLIVWHKYLCNIAHNIEIMSLNDSNSVKYSVFLICFIGY